MGNFDLEQKIEDMQRDLAVYRRSWPSAAGQAALRFVDSNFSAQGWQGNTLIPWQRTKSGKKNSFGSKSQGILIKTGHLRKGFSMVQGDDEVFIFNSIRYAKVHNEGFNGIVNVREYQRRVRRTGSFATEGGEAQIGASYSIKNRRRLKNKKVYSGTATVKAHTMHMNIPMRQFMPSKRRGSPTLDKEIRMMTQNNITKILKQIR